MLGTLIGTPVGTLPSERRDAADDVNQLERRLERAPRARRPPRFEPITSSRHAPHQRPVRSASDNGDSRPSASREGAAMGTRDVAWPAAAGSGVARWRRRGPRVSGL